MGEICCTSRKRNYEIQPRDQSKTSNFHVLPLNLDKNHVYLGTFKIVVIFGPVGIWVTLMFFAGRPRMQSYVETTCLDLLERNMIGFTFTTLPYATRLA